MSAEEQHIRVRIENVLGSVAVMHVPVCDHHPSQPVVADRMPCRDCDVVKDAEPHALVGPRVMAGGPECTEGLAAGALDHFVDRCADGSGCPAGCRQRTRPNMGVAGREHAPPGRNLAFSQRNVGFFVA